MRQSYAASKLLVAAMIMATLAFTSPHQAVAEELSAGAANSGEFGANRSGLIDRLLPSVVNISVQKLQVMASGGAANVLSSPGSDIKYYVGSGFVIDPSGIILTNYHVVQDAFEVSVTFADGTQLNAQTLGASRITDLAILKVQPPKSLPAVHWGDSDLLQVGDQVFAAGNPFGLGLSVSAGIVSALNRDLQDSPYDDLIQTDATINHGNSGGALFNMRGDVIGVTSEIISPTTGSVGLGFAIPANTARFVVDQIHTYGWVRPGWIGAKLQQLTRELANTEGIQRQGSIVSWVMPDSPAKRAGVAIGDIVLRINDKTPTDDRALLRDIGRIPAGDTITLSILHNGTARDLPMVVEAWPRSQWEARDAPLPVTQPKISIPRDLGLSMAAIAADEKTKLGLQDGLTGVLVSAVAADSDPVRQGMATGDVILRVQNAAVETPDQVLAGFDTARAAKRDYVRLLVLPKVRTVPGPKWVALRLEAAGD